MNRTLMARITQAIESPLGITVFGSFVLRVEPDIASVSFAVSRLMEQPRDAFHQVREGAQRVKTFLAQAKLDDFGASLITLSKTYEHKSGDRQFAGYLARTAFHLVLHDVNIIEEVLAGIIDSGVDELNEVEFQTSRLKAIRAEARRQAVDAARDKAENYCNAAGISLGPVIHIEDVNPDILRRRVFHGPSEDQPEEEVPEHAINPGSIAVGAAVIIAYKIGQ
jgi:uncharacterized protein YggE